MSAAFSLGPVTGPESWDHIRWIRLHGLRVDFANVGDELYYGVGLPNACQELRLIDGKYVCGIYDSRPELCRTYDCVAPDQTMFRISGSAWMVWLDSHPPGEAEPPLG
jgi:Fe-S-cluster containining protein